MELEKLDTLINLAELENNSEKVSALVALKERIEKNKDLEQVDNAQLYAGSPMYYYCNICRKLADKLPETHTCPAPSYCNECKSVKEKGWLD